MTLTKELKRKLKKWKDPDCFCCKHFMVSCNEFGTGSALNCSAFDDSRKFAILRAILPKVRV